MEPKPGDTIVVWFSCGAASAVAAKITVDKYGSTCNVIVANTDLKEEHSDNARFRRDVEKWIGVPIVSVNNKDWPESSAEVVWEKRKYMSGIHGAPCTKILKKGARYQFELDVEIHWHVLGFTANEKNRHDQFVKRERENVIPVLIDAGIKKKDCFMILYEAGVKIPYIYSLGFPNANCIGCPKSTSPRYWNLVRKHFPEIFKKRAELSRKLGVRLVEVKKGVRIYLDELPTTLRGGKLKSWECGLFCDTD